MIASRSKAVAAIRAGLLLLGMTVAAAASAWAQVGQEPIPLLPPLETAPASPAPATAPLLPAPASEGPIVMGTLPDFDADSVGTLAPGAGGFPIALWEGVGRVTVEALMRRLPVRADSRAMHALTQRLILSAATPPLGEGSESLLGLRVRTLIAMGEYGAATDLLGVAPGSAKGPDAVRLEVERAFLEARSEDACRLVQAASASAADVFWHKALIYCQAIAGQHDAAQLGLTLLTENGDDDALFAALVARLLGAAPAGELTFEALEPLHFALLQSAKVEVTEAMVEGFGPGLLAAVARSTSTPEAIALAAAERAERHGLLGADELARAYGRVSLTADERAQAREAAEQDPGPRARALLFQVAAMQGTVVARAEALAALWRHAEAAGVFASTARASAPILSQIAPGSALGWFAVDAASAALASGDAERTRGWYEVARQQAALTPEAARAFARLWPLAVISGNVPLGMGEAMGQWWAGESDRRDAAEIGRLSLALALLDALGYDVPESYWRELLSGPIRVTVSSPSAAAWHSLADASANFRLGETVLLALVVLGEDGPAGASETVVSAVLSALQAVGLESDARALAVEALLASGKG